MNYANLVWPDQGSNPWPPDQVQYMSCSWDAHLNHWTIRDLFVSLSSDNIVQMCSDWPLLCMILFTCPVCRIVAFFGTCSCKWTCTYNQIYICIGELWQIHQKAWHISLLYMYLGPCALIFLATGLLSVLFWSSLCPTFWVITFQGQT